MNLAFSQCRYLVILLSCLSILASCCTATVSREAGTGLDGVSVTDLALGPSNSSVLYAATTEGVFRSNDHGSSWWAIGPTNANVQALALAPTTPPSLYAGTDRGLFVSTDDGDSWETLTIDTETPRINLLVVDPTEPRVVYAGTGGDEVFRSTDGGESWSSVSNGLEGVYVHALAVDPHDPSTLYAGTYGDGMFRSESFGESWTAINRGLLVPHVDIVTVDPVLSDTVYASGDGGIFRSTDRGASWSVLCSTGRFSLAVDPTNADVLYAGGSSGILFRSVDGGRRWRSMWVLPDDSIARPILIDPNSPSTIYVGAGHYGVYVIRVP